jgi:WhiB family redox-sensing transcriptional regulator
MDPSYTSVVAWWQEAACRGASPSLFYATHRADHSGEALAICATCPVREPCLASALREEAHTAFVYGVRGGLTASQRQAIVCQRKRSARRLTTSVA